MIRSLFSKLVLIAFVLMAPVALMAQDNASMTGVVTDSSGAALPGTTVVLSNPSTGLSFNQVTDSKGTYRFPNVPPQKGYIATFTHEGFTKSEVRDLALSVGITRTQDAKLSVGGTQTAIEVSANSAEQTLNTTDASVGNNFQVQMLNELPVQARTSPGALFSLQPGVAASSVTGARTDQTSITLDGIDVNDIAAGSGLTGIVGNAPVDAVQEFRGTVAGLPSFLGTGSGGQFQLVTKNGTNLFHGDLNEYHRDTVTEANTWFNNNAHIARTPLIRNQFGGAIGGPVVLPKVFNGRDKLFFFFDFNTDRQIKSGSGLTVVPLDSYRNGNVSYINNNAGCSDGSTQTSAPTCISSINAAQIAALDPTHAGTNAAVLAFVNARYPHANDLTQGDGVNTGGYRFTYPTPDISYQYVGRMDYNMTSKQRLFARISVQRRDATQSLPLFATDPQTSPFQDRSYGYVISHIWQIGNNKVNQFYYGDNISVFNFPTIFDPQGPRSYTLGTFANPYVSPSGQRRRIPIPEVRDDFNWTIGSHNIGFGGTFKFIKTNSSLTNDFQFIGAGTGTAFSALDANTRPANIGTGVNALQTFDNAYLTNLGVITSLGANYNYTATGTALPNGTGAIRRYRYYQTELYVGDNWKVTPHLTLSYGLRYQLYSVPYEAQGLESVQNTKSFEQYFNARRTQSAAGIEGNTSLPFIQYNLGGKANNGPNLYAPSYKDFAPRFAFSYNPAFSPKTVVNGSVGIVYDRTVINAVNFIQDQSSYLFQNTANTLYGNANATVALTTNPRLSTGSGTKVLNYPAVPTAPAISRPYTPFVDSTGTPTGLADSQFNTIIDPTLKDPYSITYNAGIQQEFPGHFIMRLNYAGRQGRRLLAQADAAQLLDFRDATSGQGMVAAFTAVEQQLRAGVAGNSVTPQPWFENQVAPGYTRVLARSTLGPTWKRGDFADFIEALNYYGLIDQNVGMTSQFSSNTYLTNKGFSSYNGLLFSLSKNLSRGIQFDFNYTWSHSIDNVSAPANFIAGSSGYGFICDVTRPRECRAQSDFDVRHVLNSDFVAALPFGRGRAFGANSSRLLDLLIGGWSVSGTPAWRSGFAFNPTGNAYVAGYANNAPVILTGNISNLSAHRHKTSTGSVNLFASETAAASNYVGPIGLDMGARNQLRGATAFTMDAGLSKVFAILADNRLNLRFRSDFFNVLNHPVFNLPAADITSTTTFGRISGTPTYDQAGGARVGQFSLRLEF